MKRLALFSMLLSLSLFTIGCAPPADKAETPDTTVTEGEEGHEHAEGEEGHEHAEGEMPADETPADAEPTDETPADPATPEETPAE